MRLAISLLVAVTAVTLVSCGGSDDETARTSPDHAAIRQCSRCTRFEAGSRGDAPDDDGLRRPSSRRSAIPRSIPTRTR